MKKIILLSLLMGFSCLTNAQSHTLFEKSFNYEFVIPTYVKDAAGVSLLAPAGSKFTITKTLTDKYEILFWLWSEEASQNAKAYNYKNLTPDAGGKLDASMDNRKVFTVEIESLKNNAVPYHSAWFEKGAFNWSSGIVLLPVKMRNKPAFTYSKDLSLGLSGGIKWRVSRYNPTFLNLMVNVGVSSVTVDSLSTNGKIRQPSDLAALTTAVGLVLENHSFQFGIFVGKDRLSNNDFNRTGWNYDRKPWISIGLGYQILGKDSNAGGQGIPGTNSDKK